MCTQGCRRGGKARCHGLGNRNSHGQVPGDNDAAPAARRDWAPLRRRLQPFWAACLGAAQRPQPLACWHCCSPRPRCPSGACASARSSGGCGSHAAAHAAQLLRGSPLWPLARPRPAREAGLAAGRAAAAWQAGAAGQAGRGCRAGGAVGHLPPAPRVDAAAGHAHRALRAALRLHGAGRGQARARVRGALRAGADMLLPAPAAACRRSPSRDCRRPA